VPDADRVAAPPAVHPTAVVHPSAILGLGVHVGPYAVIEAETVIGEGTVIGPHSVVHRDLTMGRRNEVAAHVVLGCRPQDRAYKGERTRVVIGDDNIFSAFASVDRATGEGNETRVGNGVYVMSTVKISHNCVIGDGAVVVSGCQLGGWVTLGDHAFIGGLAGVHQFVHIGRMVMVAGLAGVRQDVPPYIMVAGAHARAVGLNTVGLRRNGIEAADRRALREAFRVFFQSGLSLDNALGGLDAIVATSAAVEHFRDFIRAARERNRGIVRWQPQTDQ
jgi:UDP-N-acetylglucosamine acyltransferase